MTPAARLAAAISHLSQAVSLLEGLRLLGAAEVRDRAFSALVWALRLKDRTSGERAA